MLRKSTTSDTAYSHLTHYLEQQTREIHFEANRLYCTLTNELILDFGDRNLNPISSIRRIQHVIRQSRRQPAYRKQLMRRQPWYPYLDREEMHAVDNLAVAGRIRVSMTLFEIHALIRWEIARCHLSTQEQTVARHLANKNQLCLDQPNLMLTAILQPAL